MSDSQNLRASRASEPDLVRDNLERVRSGLPLIERVDFLADAWEVLSGEPRQVPLRFGSRTATNYSDCEMRPRVGAPVSYGHGSDSYPGTITWVSPSGHQVKIRPDDARVVSGSFQTGDAVVEYWPGDGPEVLCQRRRGKRGRDSDGRPRYSEKHAPQYKGDRAVWGSDLFIGVRRYYQDPHF